MGGGGGGGGCSVFVVFVLDVTNLINRRRIIPVFQRAIQLSFEIAAILRVEKTQVKYVKINLLG